MFSPEAGPSRCGPHAHHVDGGVVTNAVSPEIIRSDSGSKGGLKGHASGGGGGADRAARVVRLRIEKQDVRFREFLAIHETRRAFQNLREIQNIFKK